MNHYKKTLVSILLKKITTNKRPKGFSMKLTFRDECLTSSSNMMILTRTESTYGNNLQNEERI